MLPISQSSPAVFALAECSDQLKPNSFWDAHDYLFKTIQKNGLSQDLPNKFADAMGLNYDDLMACASTANQYQTDTAFAQSLTVDGQPAITGTPTIAWRLNGGDVRFDTITGHPTSQQLGALVEENASSN